ncbi:alpha/beta hydrolase family esterase [Pseudofrankia inefficax]|uniref:Putative esterase/lipase/thioesterase n=1 Tax=Pseudofrankia inefficax (strain DSM 45817 / CECT 9037 / DDB 130130 / EuI1c) TaxID=298654 RepID=E3J9U5_PSEI1|nr:PHB depolymerase family esterase [Pseudofrankia inefficax]ADP84598.1 putative esterase/lipase/thioesterase [Pseudofrankia inefficax]
MPPPVDVQSPRSRRPPRAALLTAVALLCVLAGCGSGGTPARGLTTTAASTTGPGCASSRPATGAQTLRYDGHDRAYLLSLPTGYDARRPYPLVLDFHGAGGTKEAQEANTLMARTGTARGFIVVTPDALGDPRKWNVFEAPAAADDVGFVHALVAELNQHLCVDPTRIYAAGHSNGSAFAATLVCQTPYVFAAVAMVSATTPAACPTGVAPATLAIAGTADPQVPYAGGTVRSTTTRIPAATAVVDSYATRYGCARPPHHDRPFPEVERLTYSGCADGAAVVLDTVSGGTHAWPGGPAANGDSPSAAGESQAGKSFPATAQILDFFASHSRTMR